MGMKLGAGTLNKLMLGSAEIKKAYMGSTLFYDKTGGGGGSDVEFISFTRAGVENYYTFDLPYITGLPAGTLMTMVIGHNSSKALTTETFAGWTLVHDNGGGSNRQLWYERVATGAESGSLTIGSSTWQAYSAVMMAFSGASGIGACATQYTGTYGATSNAPSITASEGSLVLNSFCSQWYPMTPSGAGTILYDTDDQTDDSRWFTIIAEGPVTAGATAARSCAMPYSDRWYQTTIEILKS